MIADLLLATPLITLGLRLGYYAAQDLRDKEYRWAHANFVLSLAAFFTGGYFIYLAFN